MNEFIHRAVLASAATIALLVLNGCSRLPDRTLAGSGYVGEAGFQRYVLPQPARAAKVATTGAKRATGIAGRKLATTADSAKSATTIFGPKAAPTTDGTKPAATTEGVREAETIDDEGPASTTIEARPAITTNSDPIEELIGSQPNFADSRPRKPLPMRSLFNPNEKFTKETEDEARLRKIMRICTC